MSLLKKQTTASRRDSDLGAGFAWLDGEDFPPFERGWVWLIGAGPGAPGLMTLLGYHAMRHADVIVYDALVEKSLLKWASPGAHIVFSGKRGGKPSSMQQEICERLLSWAREGKRVMRLKGGDPFMFGRGGEECEFLSRAGVPFRIVPGVSAGLGGLAYAGIPVTHRLINHSVVFLTGHDASGDVPKGVDWHALALTSPVIVMYMAMRNLSAIAKRLLAGGRAPSDPVGIASCVSLPRQSVMKTTLERLSDHFCPDDCATPAIIVIGRVVELHSLLDWYTGALRANPLG